MNDLINVAARELIRFLSTHLPKLSEKWWENHVVDRLSSQQQRIVRERGFARLEQLDLAALLRILDQNWFELSSDLGLQREGRNWVKELQTVRNNWAHASIEEPPASQNFRDADTLGRLLDILDAEDAARQIVEKAKSKALSAMVPSTPAKDKPGLSQRATAEEKTLPEPATQASGAPLFSVGQSITPHSGPGRVNRPLRHISIRVPWHDSGWNGRVCSMPRLNSACLNLASIAKNRDDNAEEENAGKSLEEVPYEQWPPCVAEGMGFMAPFEYTRFKNHPYNRRCAKNTPLRHPPYSALVVPFYWMLRKNMTKLADAYGIDAKEECEPDLGFQSAKTWVQDQGNQQALLECFRDHIRPEKSLCFFYTKQIPFVEDVGARSILIGVGRVQHVTPPQEYDYITRDMPENLRSMLWELMVQHSIRPDFKDGFLLPYHAAIQKVREESDFDPVDIVAYSPADHALEFSHVSQLVTHEGAIASLLSCVAALRNAQRMLPGKWDHCLGWVDARLGELQEAHTLALD